MRYFIRIERECFSERARFDAYAVQEKRLERGAIRELEAFDLDERYGRKLELPVIILTEGEPDNYRY